MIKYWLVLLGGFLTSAGLRAQTAQVHTEVQVLIRDFMQISEISRGQLVTLGMDDEEDFANGITKIVPDNLLISTTVEYNVFARAAFPYFTSLQNNRSFPASVLSLEVDVQEPMSGSTVFNKINGLVTNNQPLILNGAPMFKSYLNIKYSIPAAMAKNILVKSGAGLYTNTIIYTITPQ
jgi:hypothetical protein